MRYANRDKPGARRNPGSPTSERGPVRRSSKSGAGLVLRSPRGGAGFTLLEVLVAMTILAILGAALFTVFSQSTGTWLRADARVQQFVAAREVLGLMTLEMRHAVAAPHSGGTFGAQFYGVDKDGDPGWRGSTVDNDSGQIYFVAPTEMRSEGAQQDLCVIGYWVKDDAASDEPGKQLMRYCLSDNQTGWSSFDPNSNIPSQELGVNVKSLTFEFWDHRPGNEGWDNAVDSWASDPGGPSYQQNTVPRAVRITLVVLDPTVDQADPEAAKKDRTFTTVVYMNNSR